MSMLSVISAKPLHVYGDGFWIISEEVLPQFIQIRRTWASPVFPFSWKIQWMKHHVTESCDVQLYASTNLRKGSRFVNNILSCDLSITPVMYPGRPVNTVYGPHMGGVWPKYVFFTDTNFNALRIGATRSRSILTSLATPPAPHWRFCKQTKGVGIVMLSKMEEVHRFPSEWVNRSWFISMCIHTRTFTLTSIC